jgi:hypothetical protein
MIVPPLLAILIAMAAVLNRMHCPMRHVQDYTPKPLDAAVGQLLSLYCPGGCQGNIKQNNDDKCTNFAIRFDGRGGMPVVHGFPLNAAIGQALAPITSIRHANVGCLLYISLSNRQRIPQLPLITIGV